METRSVMVATFVGVIAVISWFFFPPMLFRTPKPTPEVKLEEMRFMSEGEGVMNIATPMAGMLGAGPSKPTPMFTVTFNAEGATQEDYLRFINDVRSRLQNNQAPQVTHGVTVARPTNRWNPPMFAVDLRTQTGTATLYLRADTVYLEGYRDEGGHLFELDQFDRQGRERHRWTGSTFMGFGETYRDFRRAGGPLIGTAYGPGQMTEAINRLARGEHDGTSIVTIVVMLSEAVRFNPIRDFMGKLYNTNQSAIAPTWWETLVHRWSGLSQGLLYDIDDPVDFSIFADIDVLNANDAADTLGLILNPCGPWRPGGGRSKRDVSSQEAEVCYGGSPMLEIFKVVVMDIAGESSGYLYGIVDVVSEIMKHSIYARMASYSEPVKRYGEATLTGPAQAMLAHGGFTISFDLLENSGDREVAKGDVYWDLSDDMVNEYDTVLEASVKGEKGEVQVSYAVYQSAAEATVKVVLVNGDGENPADIYGTIVVRSSFANTGTVLFSRKARDNVPVKPWEEVPLLRSVVAAPLNADKLVVEVDFPIRMSRSIALSRSTTPPPPPPFSFSLPDPISWPTVVRPGRPRPSSAPPPTPVGPLTLAPDPVAWVPRPPPVASYFSTPELCRRRSSQLHR